MPKQHVSDTWHCRIGTTPGTTKPNGGEFSEGQTEAPLHKENIRYKRGADCEAQLKLVRRGFHS
jgi:hypothetical protein